MQFCFEVKTTAFSEKHCFSIEKSVVDEGQTLESRRRRSSGVWI